MEWNPGLLSLAGILFGGGMIGQLVIFFVKRHDKKNEETQKFYRVIYNKLCEYHSTLEEMRIMFNKDIYKHVKLTESTCSVIEDNLQKINGLIKSIKSNKRKCRKNTKTDNNLCNKCSFERNLGMELNDVNRKLLQESQTNMDIINNYWRDNYEHTFSTIASYSNIENYIYAKNGCNKSIQMIVRKIDKSTNEICGYLPSKSLDIWDFDNIIIKQLGNINNALQLISRHL